MDRQKRKPVKLKDIAQRANVSPSLVSLILNGKGRASDKVRRKVLNMLEKAGFRPKYTRKPVLFLVDLERIMGGGKTIPVMRQLKGVQEKMAEEGVTMQVEFLAEVGANSVVTQLEQIRERGPGGIMLNTDAPWFAEAGSIFERASIPFVQLGYDTEDPRYSGAVVDSFSGAYQAVKFLAGRGHKRIAILRWETGIARVNSHKKHAGYLTALAEAGLEPDQQLIVHMEATQYEKGWKPIRELVLPWSKLKAPPTALFVENSFVSLSLLYPLERDKATLPRFLADLDMFHFEDWPLDPVDDIMCGKLFYPEAQTNLVTIDWETIGRMAAQLLIELINHGGRLPPKIIRVAPLLHRMQGHKRTLLEQARANETDCEST